MSGFTPLTWDELAAMAKAAFNNQPGVKPANTDAGSALGPVFNAGGLQGAFVENQLSYTASLVRMNSIPAMPDGSPNPDLDSFWAPFNIPRVGATAANGNVTVSTPSPVGSQIVIPANVIVNSLGGVPFIFQAGGAGYDAGLGGYPISAGNSSATLPQLCLVDGIVGNVPAGTKFTAAGTGPPLPGNISSIVAAADYTNARNVESDADYKVRATITSSSGRGGTRNSILAAILALQPGILCSIGDRVNADLSFHGGYYRVFVNLAGTGIAPSPTFVAAALAAAEGATSLGISLDCTAPTIQSVNAVAGLVKAPGFAGQDAAVIAAAKRAYDLYVNGLGLAPAVKPTDDPSVGQTVCSLARSYAAILSATINGVLCVTDVINLTLNATSSDVVAPFGTQLVSGTKAFTVS